MDTTQLQFALFLVKVAVLATPATLIIVGVLRAITWRG
jgi:hypothetical protein